MAAEFADDAVESSAWERFRALQAMAAGTHPNPFLKCRTVAEAAALQQTAAHWLDGTLHQHLLAPGCAVPPEVRHLLLNCGAKVWGLVTAPKALELVEAICSDTPAAVYRLAHECHSDIACFFWDDVPIEGEFAGVGVLSHLWSRPSMRPLVHQLVCEELIDPHACPAIAAALTPSAGCECIAASSDELPPADSDTPSVGSLPGCLAQALASATAASSALQ